MDKIITDNSKVNLNLLKENETLKNLLEIERQQVKRLAEQLNLCGVSQQRELLEAYDKFAEMEHAWFIGTEDETKDKFLAASNCG